MLKLCAEHSAYCRSNLRHVGDKCARCGQELIELHRWQAPSGRWVVVPVEARGRRRAALR